MHRSYGGLPLFGILGLPGNLYPDRGDPAALGDGRALRRAWLKKPIARCAGLSDIL